LRNQTDLKEKIANLFIDLSVQFRIPDHAPFSDSAFPHFELGLYQSDNACGISHEFQNCWNNDAKRNERCINRDQIYGLGDSVCVHMADVGSLDHHDARVLTQFPRQLTVSHIDREKPFRPRVEGDNQ